MSYCAPAVPNLRYATSSWPLKDTRSRLRPQGYLGEMAGARKGVCGERPGRYWRLWSPDNPDQELRVFKIVELKESWLKAMERLIAQRGTGTFSTDALTDIRAQADGVFDSLEDFNAAERDLRVSRANHQKGQYQVLVVLVPFLIVLVMAALSYWGWRQIQKATDQFHEALDAAELARAQAEQASTRAERANRAKDTFLGTVSHELRNPLNSILLWSTALLRDQSLNESARRGMNAIERAVRIQGQLIEDLLDISRIESGRLRLDVQNVDLAEVVRAGVDSMRAAAEAKSIAIHEILDPRVDFISGDPGRLQQVVWNLVSNAVKFTPKGGKIQVRLERINSHVEIIVADTGRGIESASLGSVFERFWQEDDGVQSKHGVGLGLSIVKELVSLHGGTVSAHSDGSRKGQHLHSPAAVAVQHQRFLRAPASSDGRTNRQSGQCRTPRWTFDSDCRRRP